MEPLQPGQRIGAYRIIRKLGAGGMGQVYEAEHVALGARRALKVFSTESEHSEFLRKRFVAEGRILADLKHPRIVRVYDLVVDEDSGMAYFEMDLVLSPNGQPRTLADEQREGVGEEKIVGWFKDICEGLAYIHSQGVVHRDISLDNILIGPDGHAVITDFGIAKIIDDSYRKKIDVTVTMVYKDGFEMRMGKGLYMAPELKKQGGKATFASDAYAVGVILFRLLSGSWYDVGTHLEDWLADFEYEWHPIISQLCNADPEKRLGKGGVTALPGQLKCKAQTVASYRWTWVIWCGVAFALAVVVASVVHLIKNEHTNDMTKYRIVNPVEDLRNMVISNGGKILKAYNGNETVLQIPEGVEEITRDAFVQIKRKVTTLVLPLTLNRLAFKHSIAFDLDLHMYEEDIGRLQAVYFKSNPPDVDNELFWETYAKLEVHVNTSAKGWIGEDGNLFSKWPCDDYRGRCVVAWDGKTILDMNKERLNDIEKDRAAVKFAASIAKDLAPSNYYEMAKLMDLSLSDGIKGYRLFDLWTDSSEHLLLECIKAMESGETFPMFLLGLWFERGGITTNSIKAVDLKTSVSWYHRGAEKGDGSCMAKLAECYRQGRGVMQNDEKAFKYYKQSAEQNIITGMEGLGDCYLYGIGTPTNRIEATKWYKKAAERSMGIRKLKNGCGN